MRGAATLALLGLLLTACGSATTQSGEGEEPGGSGVRAVDRPAPDAFERWAHPAGGPYEITVTSGDLCAEGADCEAVGKTWDTCAPETKDPACQAMLEESRKMHERWLEQIRPAADVEPRVVAEFNSENREDLELVVWRTTSGRLCGLARALGDDAGAPQQLVGECAPAPCGVICPSLLVPVQGRAVLIGMVTREAEALRITTDTGSAFVHVLDGPTIPGSNLQPLFVELGETFWQKLEVFRDGRLLDTIEIPVDEGDVLLCEAGQPVEECEEGEAELDE